MYGGLKRCFDIIGAGVGLVILMPVLAIVASLVAWKIGRPVLFRQMRPGLAGRPFEILKFRTMRDLLDDGGSPLPDDQRLTAFGRALRASSLDELPELWNVIKGEMSLVGPRPLLTQYLARYTVEQYRRHDARPGITGWAQINGRNAITWEQKFRLDVWYVDNAALWLDIKILIVTVWHVFRRHGISAAGTATMNEFLGN